MTEKHQTAPENNPKSSAPVPPYLVVYVMGENVGAIACPTFDMANSVYKTVTAENKVLDYAAVITTVPDAIYPMLDQWRKDDAE